MADRWGAHRFGGAVYVHRCHAYEPPLLEAGRDPSSAETRSLLARWGRLHAVRSTLSFLATVVYVFALVET